MKTLATLPALRDNSFVGAPDLGADHYSSFQLRRMAVWEGQTLCPALLTPHPRSLPEGERE